MKNISVNLKNRSYQIHIEPGLIKNVPIHLSKYNNGQKWIIISQQNIMEIIGYNIEKRLNEKEFDCSHITLPIAEFCNFAALNLLHEDRYHLSITWVTGKPL